MTTKILALTDALGNLVRFVLLPWPSTRVEALLARGYIVHHVARGCCEYAM